MTGAEASAFCRRRGVTSECFPSSDFSYILTRPARGFPSMFVSHPERNPHRAVLQGLQRENQGAEGGNPSTHQDPREGASRKHSAGVSNPPLTFPRSVNSPPRHRPQSTTGHLHYSSSSTELSLCHLHSLMEQCPEELGVRSA